MSPTMKLRQLIGTLPSEPKDKARLRFHQGWWRSFVLDEPQGPHPLRRGESVCNVVSGGEHSLKNLIGDGARAAVERTLLDRKNQGKAAGLIDERRLYNNLLSSQPLVFNFFGNLQQDRRLATQLMSRLVPGIDEVLDVRFEYAPRPWIDNSAFDVALVVKSRGETGLLGIECKFTETFSPTVYDIDEYRDIAKDSSAFGVDYETCIAPRFNQLFRNQLIAERLVQRGEYAFRMTGLFCHESDTSAIATGNAFKALLVDGAASFHVLTYARFLEELQQLPLSWDQRSSSMMLWARYCALELSEAAYRSAE